MSDEVKAADATLASLQAENVELKRRLLKLEARIDPPDPAIAAKPAVPYVDQTVMKRVARIPDEVTRRMAEAVPTDLVRAIVRDNRGW